jgi:ankyrin repeat protein
MNNKYFSEEQFQAQEKFLSKFGEWEEDGIDRLMLKSIREDHEEYFGEFTKELFKHEYEKLRIPLGELYFPRRKAKREGGYNPYRFKIQARNGQLTVIDSEDKSQSMYTDERKKTSNGEYFTKPQSFSVSNPQEGIWSRIFDVALLKNNVAVGVIIKPTKENLLPSGYFLPADSGTYFRPFAFPSHRAAELALKYLNDKKTFNNNDKLEFAKNFSTKAEAEIALKRLENTKMFESEEKLLSDFKKNPGKYHYNEALYRATMPVGEPENQIGIFVDNLQSRLLAQFRAIDFKENSKKDFMPITFYLPDGNEKYYPYELKDQQKDIEVALSNGNNKEKAFALVLDFYYRNKANLAADMNKEDFFQTVKQQPEEVKKEIFKLLSNSNKMSPLGQYNFFNIIFGEKLSDRNKKQLIDGVYAGGNLPQEIKPFFVNDLYNRGAPDKCPNELLPKKISSIQKNKAAMEKAIGSSDYNTVEELIGKGVTVNFFGKHWGYPLLHSAIKKSERKIVELLIKNGAYIEQGDDRKETPLQVAINTGDIEMVGSLIEEGANVNNGGDNNIPPLEYAARLVREKKTDKGNVVREHDKEKSKKMVSLLIRKHADVNAKNNSPLKWAINNNNKDNVELLLTSKAEVSFLLEESKREIGLNNYLEQCINKNLTNVIYALTKSTPNIDQSCYKKMLNYAVGRKNKEMMQFLIDINPQNKYNFDFAKMLKEFLDEMPINLEGIKWLLENETRLGISSKDHNYNHHHILSEVLRSDCKKVDDELMLNVVKLLKEEKRAKYENNNGDFALLTAAKNGHAKVVEYLLDRDSRKNPANRKALFLPPLQGSKKHDTNDNGEFPLYLAARNGHNEVVKKLLARNTVVDQEIIKKKGSDHLKTALHIAAVGGHTDIIETLLDWRANIHAKDTDGNTPLHVAAKYHRASSAIKLLEKGANYDTPNTDNKTPLELFMKGYDDYYRSDYTTQEQKEALEELHKLFTKKNSRSSYTPQQKMHNLSENTSQKDKRENQKKVRKISNNNS